METQSITLTESASLRILNVLKDTTNSKFRVYVTGGGCSGFQYGFKFDDDEALMMHTFFFKNSGGVSEHILDLELLDKFKDIL
mgnify:CR=1 FL=1